MPSATRPNRAPSIPVSWARVSSRSCSRPRGKRTRCAASTRPSPICSRSRAALATRAGGEREAELVAELASIRDDVLHDDAGRFAAYRHLLTLRRVMRPPRKRSSAPRRSAPNGRTSPPSTSPSRSPRVTRRSRARCSSAPPRLPTATVAPSSRPARRRRPRPRRDESCAEEHPRREKEEEQARQQGARRRPQGLLREDHRPPQGRPRARPEEPPRRSPPGAPCSVTRERWEDLVKALETFATESIVKRRRSRP